MLCWYLNWKHVHSIGFLSGANGFASIHSRPLLISQARARTIGSMICSLQNAPPAQCTLTFHNRPKVIRTRAGDRWDIFCPNLFRCLPACLPACLAACLPVHIFETSVPLSGFSRGGFLCSGLLSTPCWVRFPNSQTRMRMVPVSF